MPYVRFLIFSLFGGVFWIAFMMTLGYQLGQVEIVRQNFEKVVLAVIFVSLIPVALQARRATSRDSVTTL
jgi:membrane-associated protein